MTQHNFISLILSLERYIKSHNQLLNFLRMNLFYYIDNVGIHFRHCVLLNALQEKNAFLKNAFQ